MTRLKSSPSLSHYYHVNALLFKLVLGLNGGSWFISWAYLWAGSLNTLITLAEWISGFDILLALNYMLNMLFVGRGRS